MSDKHFDRIVSSYVAYYHQCRPQQGIGNVLLPKSGETAPSPLPDALPHDHSDIKCNMRLGGLLRHYYGEAA